jgi:hypothetical protein
VSSYQYYEFQAIDRLLTEDEQHAVARLSSRVEPHPRQAVFVYHWSSFPADPREILLKYFDALFYTSSWGSRQLMFRFPRAAVDVASAMAYCQPLIVEETISFSTEAAYILLNIEFHEEGGSDWMEEPGSLSAMLNLRDDIVRGDYRVLYLAWLKALEVEDLLRSVLEPPLPPGLKALSPALHTFVDFLGIDETLIQVAAEASGEPQAPPADWLRGAVARLADEERNAFLLRLARGEAHLSAALNQRLRALAPWSGTEPPPRRTVGKLLRAAKDQRERQHRQQVEEAEAKRIQELQALAEREPQAWAEVDALIQQMNARAYDGAVQLLVRLRDLAEYQGQETAFQQRLDAIHEQYSRRSALLHRLRDAGLARL